MISCVVGILLYMIKKKDQQQASAYKFFGDFIYIYLGGRNDTMTQRGNIKNINALCRVTI